ncbi:MAG: hypothetical protein WCP67_00110 [Verrucomicrobiota bacterium]
MSKLTHFALLWAASFTASQAAEAPVKPWMVIADWQTRRAETVNHADPVSGTFGRSRSGTEVIWATPTAAVDFEYYRYKNDFTGNIQGSDQAYGHTTDLMLTGFKQWDWNAKYSVQTLYALESAYEEGVGLSRGFRWGFGGAARWRPDAETDITLGVMLQDRFEAGVLPVPYFKAVWRPCQAAEVELRATGLQNGLIIRGYLTEDRATRVDLSVMYETLTFRLADSSTYGSRAVSIGEVPLRIGVTQFLERSGTWFVQGSFEWVAFSRQSFVHAGETQGVFQTAATWGFSARVGARF